MTMTRTHKIAVVGVLLGVIGLGLGLGLSGVALGQQNDTDGSEDSTEIEEQLGELVIHSVEWSESNSSVEIEATWRGDTSTQISSIELIKPDSQSEQIGIDQTRVLPGDRTTITVQLSRLDGVIVSTPESIERGDALLLQPDSGGGGTQVRLLYGVLLGVGLGGAGAGYAAVRRQRSTSEIEQVGSNDEGLL
jgi:hypothetical protein